MTVDQVVDLKDVDPSEVHVTDGKPWTTKGITDAEFTASAITFLTAGYDTTSASLMYFSYSLALNPEIQEQVCFTAIHINGILMLCQFTMSSNLCMDQ